MKPFYQVSILFIVFIFGCNEHKKENINADVIVNESIEASGGPKITTSVIGFDFRDKHYRAIRNKGIFQFERYIKDSTKTIKDVLMNKGFRRYIEDSLIEVPDTMAVKYAASVNSVHYFSVLPYGLNSKAVNKTFLETVSINGKDYYKIKVTFNEEGGGEDFEDVYVYWINSITKKVDYLAYSYNESDGKGLRFREAYNERYVKGIRFLDYNNYKPKASYSNLLKLDSLFVKDDLELLSKIELKNITVN